MKTSSCTRRSALLLPLALAVSFGNFCRLVTVQQCFNCPALLAMRDGDE